VRTTDLGSPLGDQKICGVLTNPSLLFSHMIADAVVRFLVLFLLFRIMVHIVILVNNLTVKISLARYLAIQYDTRGPSGRWR
jgi:hypothetical protein